MVQINLILYFIICILWFSSNSKSFNFFLYSSAYIIKGLPNFGCLIRLSFKLPKLGTLFFTVLAFQSFFGDWCIKRGMARRFHEKKMQTVKGKKMVSWKTNLCEYCSRIWIESRIVFFIKGYSLMLTSAENNAITLHIFMQLTFFKHDRFFYKNIRFWTYCRPEFLLLLSIIFYYFL